jgi:hypothetical protein
MSPVLSLLVCFSYGDLMLLPQASLCPWFTYLHLHLSSWDCRHEPPRSSGLHLPSSWDYKQALHTRPSFFQKNEVTRDSCLPFCFGTWPISAPIVPYTMVQPYQAASSWNKCGNRHTHESKWRRWLQLKQSAKLCVCVCIYIYKMYVCIYTVSKQTKALEYYWLQELLWPSNNTEYNTFVTSCPCDLTLLGGVFGSY